MTDHDRINDESAETLAEFLAVRMLREIASLDRNGSRMHNSSASNWTLLAVPTPLIERIDEFLHAVGRAPDRPADLVPLANGRSVNLAGNWKLPI